MKIRFLIGVVFIFLFIWKIFAEKSLMFISPVDKAKDLILNREKNEKNLDLAIELLEELRLKENTNEDVLILLSETYFLISEMAGQGKYKHLKIANTYSEQVINLNPKNFKGHYWYGLTLLHLAEFSRGLTAYRLAKKAIDSLETVIKLNGKDYDSAGAYRLLGKISYESPPKPFFGDSKKAINYLEKAKEIAPEFILNRLYLAQAYIKINKIENAREELKWIINAPLNSLRETEDTKNKNAAKKILEKFK